MSLVHNERTKLTATWLNTLGAGSVVVGVFTPTVAIAGGSIGPDRLFGVMVLGATFLAVGLTLHLAARAILGDLKP